MRYFTYSPDLLWFENILKNIKYAMSTRIPTYIIIECHTWCLQLPLAARSNPLNNYIKYILDIICNIFSFHILKLASSSQYPSKPKDWNNRQEGETWIHCASWFPYSIWDNQISVTLYSVILLDILIYFSTKWKCWLNIPFWFFINQLQSLILPSNFKNTLYPTFFMISMSAFK